MYPRSRSSHNLVESHETNSVNIQGAYDSKDSGRYADTGSKRRGVRVWRGKMGELLVVSHWALPRQNTDSPSGDPAAFPYESS